jgi:tRNA U34 2-thiouridine synthase MnmA/TrmU
VLIIIKINLFSLPIVARAIIQIFIGELTSLSLIAAQMELVTAEKKDSQGLCFIGVVYRNFATEIAPKEGDYPN